MQKESNLITPCSGTFTLHGASVQGPSSNGQDLDIKFGVNPMPLTPWIHGPQPQV